MCRCVEVARDQLALGVVPGAVADAVARVDGRHGRRAALRRTSAARSGRRARSCRRRRRRRPGAGRCASAPARPPRSAPLPLPALVMKKLIGPVDGVVAQAASSVVAAAVRAKARILRIGAPWSVDGIAKPVLRAGTRNPSSGSSLHRERGLPYGVLRRARTSRAVAPPRGPPHDDQRHDFSQRLSAVPGAADHRQADPAAVRRRRGGVGHLPGLLPARRCCSATPTRTRWSSATARARLRRVHVALLLVSLLVLPIIPGEAASVMSDASPSARIVGLLLATIGLPFALLATTSPLLQAWLAREGSGRDPYRLFVVSNLASLFALMSYPWLIEPWLGTATQARVWSALYALYVCARRRGGHHQRTPCAAAQQPGRGRAATVRRTGRAACHRLQAPARLDGAGRTGELRAGGGDQPPDAERAVDPDDVGAAARCLPADASRSCFDGDRWYRPRVFAPRR